MYSLSKYVLPAACALVALAACGCKGRHADGTPTGETVEVNVEEFVAVDSAAVMPARPADTAAPAAPAPEAEAPDAQAPAAQPAPAEAQPAPAPQPPAPALQDPALPSAR